jgi:hypothetical protein
LQNNQQSEDIVRLQQQGCALVFNLEDKANEYIESVCQIIKGSEWGWFWTVPKNNPLGFFIFYIEPSTVVLPVITFLTLSFLL